MRLMFKQNKGLRVAVMTMMYDNYYSPQGKGQTADTSGMCYPVCGMVYIKDPLLLIEKSSQSSGGSRFPLSLSELSFTICPTPYNLLKCFECIIK